MPGPVPRGDPCFRVHTRRDSPRRTAAFRGHCNGEPCCIRSLLKGAWPGAFDSTTLSSRRPLPSASSARPVNSVVRNQHLRGENMLKMTRLALLAAALIVALPAALAPATVQAQAQPAPPATPSTTPPPPPMPATTVTPAPAAPTAAPKVGEKTTEIIENPYGLEALWKGGDMVARITLLILVVMSMGSWYIIITKVYEQYKMLRHGKSAEKSFWKAPSVKQGAEGLKKTSPYRFIAETGLEATARHTGLF